MPLCTGAVDEHGAARDVALLQRGHRAAGAGAGCAHHQRAAQAGAPPLVMSHGFHDTCMLTLRRAGMENPAVPGEAGNVSWSTLASTHAWHVHYCGTNLPRWSRTHDQRICRSARLECTVGEGGTRRCRTGMTLAACGLPPCSTPSSRRSTLMQSTWGPAAGGRRL